jgi:hypothetical protein
LFSTLQIVCSFNKKSFIDPKICRHVDFTRIIVSS